MGDQWSPITVFAGDKAAAPYRPHPRFWQLKKKKKHFWLKSGFDLLRTNVDLTKITALDRSAIPHWC